MRQLGSVQDSMTRYVCSVLQFLHKSRMFLILVFFFRFSSELGLLVDEETTHEGSYFG